MAVTLSASLGVPDGVESLKFVVELDTNRVESTRKGSLGYAYMPKNGVVAVQ